MVAEELSRVAVEVIKVAGGNTHHVVTPKAPRASTSHEGLATAPNASLNTRLPVERVHNSAGLVAP